MEIVTRKEAKEKGLSRYYTGKPCKYGHVAERYVSYRSCIECSKNRVKKYLADNPEGAVEKAREYRENNREKIAKQKRQYREANRDQILKYQRQYYKNNLHVSRANDARRRAAKLQRTPVWSETEQIKEFYANCPDGYHVDHIVPLQGETVSGLHVIGNLQYLTAEENVRKGNRFG